MVRRLVRRGWAEWLVPFALLLAVALVFGQAGDPEDWASSPEAYLLTKQERADWYKLDSRESRAAFKQRYWLKRDPTPGTAKNELMEAVLTRIKTADARFGMENTPGSRTARGLVFIVLGSPARVQDEHAPQPAPDRPGGRRVGEGFTPVALVEGNETTSTWLYDRDRTPRILEAIERPSLEIKIVIEPSRHKDAIQDPGLFNDIREIVARKSIANPDLIPPSDAPAGAQGVEPLPRQALNASVRQILQEAPAVARHGSGFVGCAVVFRETGEAETLLWVFTPPPSRRPLLHALLRSEDGREVASFSEPAAVSPVFSTHAPGLVALKRVPLSPGFYSAAIALTEEGGKLLASAVLPVQVPSLAKDFAVSSLIVTRGPGPAGQGSDPVFSFAGTSLPPRADAVFSASESLWYFLEIANPKDPSKVSIEPRLRRGGEAMAELPPFAPKLQPIGQGRYMAGIELPLQTLSPGDYVIYVTVADGEGAGATRVLRRTDFQLVR